MYFDSAIALISICSLGLASLSLAEDTIPYEQPDTVKNIQLQRLDNSLAANIKTLKSVESPSLPVPLAAIALVKEFEGFESHAYIDTDGTPVIGYGLSKIEGISVKIGDRISTEKADAALNAQLQEIQRQLNKSIKVDLNEEQLSALASLSFNVGVNFIQDSTLVRKLNAGDFEGAANEFLRWDQANVGGRLVQMPGLTRRRQAERNLFLYSDS